MKSYLVVAATFVYVIASIGFILPFLVSATNTLLVAVGFVYALSMPLITTFLYRYFCKLQRKDDEIEDS